MRRRKVCQVMPKHVVYLEVASAKGYAPRESGNGRFFIALPSLKETRFIGQHPRISLHVVNAITMIVDLTHERGLYLMVSSIE